MSGCGYNGEAAVAEPTGVHVPLARFWQSRCKPWTLPRSCAYGSASATERLGASVALCVTSVTTWTRLSAVSRVAVTANDGEYDSEEQPVTESGALAVLTVESP